jgi:hypothetical protein
MASLRPDAEAISKQQHAQHQIRIDGGASRVAIERSKLLAHFTQIKLSIGLPDEMTKWHLNVQDEAVEQPILRAALATHHVDVLHPDPLPQR